MEIRSTQPSDSEAELALLREVFPEFSATLASLRHWRASTPASARPSYVVAEVDGRVVGNGLAMLDWFSTSPTDALADVKVAAPQRGRGIGAALWERLARHLDELDAEVVRVQATDDAATARFAEQRGFRQTSTSEVLVLDPTAAGTPADAPEVEVRPCSAFGDDPTPVFELDAETMQDEPGDHDFGGVTFESWHAMTYGAPNFDQELSKVAVLDGQLVGATFVYADRDGGRATNGGTGVRRPLRGQGIASLLKRCSLEDMASLGIRQLFTTNDATNAPMLAINRRLGFAPFATRTAWRLDRKR